MLVNQFNETGRPDDSFEEVRFFHQGLPRIAFLEEQDPFKASRGELFLFARYDISGQRFRYKFWDAGQGQTCDELRSLTRMINGEYVDQGKPNDVHVLQIERVNNHSLLAYDVDLRKIHRYTIGVLGQLTITPL